MKYRLLILSIMLFSPIAQSNTTTTIFSWLDNNGVMHFTDKKPKVSIVAASELLTTKNISVTNILEVPTVKPEPTQVPDVAKNVSPIANDN